MAIIISNNRPQRQSCPIFGGSQSAVAANPVAANPPKCWTRVTSSSINRYSPYNMGKT